MKLSERDLEILAYLQHRADSSVAELAKLSGYRENAVRYCLASLRERNLLKRRTYINIYPLGYHKQAFFFTVTSDSQRRREQLLDFLIRSPSIAYVAELGGEYEYKADVCGRNIEDFTGFLDVLTGKFGDLLHAKAFATLIQLADFPMTVKGVRSYTLTMGVRSQRVEIDELDHRLLCKLSTIDMQSYSDIARSLGIPLSTIEYRVKQLKAKKVIVGTRYLVDRAALGLSSFFHLVYARGLNLQIRDKLFQYCCSHPHTDYFVQCMCSWDYEIGTTVASAPDTIALVQGLYENFGKSIDNIVTLPLFRYLKVSNYPFAEDMRPSTSAAYWCSALPE